jgi:hypothetical protein
MVGELAEIIKKKDIKFYLYSISYALRHEDMTVQLLVS